MNHRFTTASVSMLFLLLANSLALNPANQQVRGPQDLERRFRLEPFGYIVLPKGYKAYQEKAWVDVWYGFIVSKDGAMRIHYSAGLVQTPFEAHPGAFLWSKTG